MTKEKINEWDLIHVDAYYLLKKGSKAEKIFNQYVEDVKSMVDNIREYAKQFLPSDKCDMAINANNGFVGFTIKDKKDLPEGWRLANSRYEYRVTQDGELLIYPHQGRKGGRALAKAIYGKNMPKPVHSKELVKSLGFGYSKVFCGMASWSGCGYKVEDGKIKINVALFRDEKGKLYHQESHKMVDKLPLVAGLKEIFPRDY